MLTQTPLLEKLDSVNYLSRQGLNARSWSDLSADAAYDIDAGVTEADYAVAETGSLVIRHRPEHGRLLSLVPFVHVAIIEPRIIVPDLLDHVGAHASRDLARPDPGPRDLNECSWSPHRMRSEARRDGQDREPVNAAPAKLAGQAA